MKYIVYPLIIFSSYLSLSIYCLNFNILKWSDDIKIAFSFILLFPIIDYFITKTLDKHDNSVHYVLPNDIDIYSEEIRKLYKDANKYLEDKTKLAVEGETTIDINPSFLFDDIICKTDNMQTVKINNNMEDNELQNSVRDNFIDSLVTYIRICNPKQIASDLNIISKYFSEESPIKKYLEPISDKTCKDIENIVEQIRNDIKNK